MGLMQSVAAALARLGDLAATPTVSRLANAFAVAGHELALVGGPVRDAFLDRPLHDRLLNEVLQAPASEPGLTLNNTLAQRAARELLKSADSYF